jgi:hypothetical protein
MDERDRFELELADALRAYAEEASTEVRPTELARQFATTDPRRRAAFGPWRLGPTARLAWVVLLLAGLLATMVGGMLITGSQPERTLPVVVPPIGQVLTCPPGTNPDEPGPVDQARPPSGPMAFDRASGKIVLVGSGEGSGPAETWTFDVCANTWEAMHPASEPDLGLMGMLAYDTAAQRTISMNRLGRVWAYDLASNTWTMGPRATNVWGGVRLA